VLLSPSATLAASLQADGDFRNAFSGGCGLWKTAKIEAQETTRYAH
jgi:hypothetical protein